MNYNNIVKSYPGTWVGVSIPYNRQVTPLWNEWAKGAIPVRAFDFGAKIWWMPASSVPLALNEGLALGLLSPDQFRTGMAANERILQTRGRDSVGERPANAYSDAFAVFGLGPGAPPKLIDLVYRWWKNEFQSAGGSTAVQEEILDEAYVTLGGKLDTQQAPR